MTALFQLTHDAAVSASITGLVYTGTVAIAALIAVAAPTAERRHDARAVLKLMLRVSSTPRAKPKNPAPLGRDCRSRLRDIHDPAHNWSCR